MRHLFFYLILVISFNKTLAQGASYEATDTIYCIQIMSTRNPHLVKPESVPVVDESLVVEDAGDWKRILVVCESRDAAEILLQNWRNYWKDCLIVSRNREQISRTVVLFSMD